MAIHKELQCHVHCKVEKVKQNVKKCVSMLPFVDGAWVSMDKHGCDRHDERSLPVAGCPLLPGRVQIALCS